MTALRAGADVAAAAVPSKRAAASRDNAVADIDRIRRKRIYFLIDRFGEDHRMVITEIHRRGRKPPEVAARRDAVIAPSGASVVRRRR
jgi:hypothetical protein